MKCVCGYEQKNDFNIVTYYTKQQIRKDKRYGS